MIQESPTDAEYVSGTLEVTLDQPNSVLREQFPVSFPAWSLSNYMMKDVASGRWVTLSDWSRERRDRRVELPWWARQNLSALGILALVGLLLIAAVAAAVRHQFATDRRVREDALLRAKLILNAEHAASRDERVLTALERQRSLLETALSGTRHPRRWFPRSSRSPATSADDTAPDFVPNKAQRQALELYATLRDLDDTRPALRARRVPRRTWLLGTGILLCLLALLLIGAIKTFLLMFGIVAGMTLMLLANRELFAQVWPVLRRALDWSKVDALLKSQHNGK